MTDSHSSGQAHSHNDSAHKPAPLRGILGWIDYRLPIISFMRDHLQSYPTPRNLNFLWNFGSLAGIVLVIMILSGIFLAMHYVPNTHFAFESVEYIMREVNYGWLLRYIHMNGASMFFIIVYLHIFRGLYYGSYKAPRELLWIIGIVIFLLMMATAFMGYVLPWGQMSFWGATVITNLFSAIPIFGHDIVTWLWGGFSVDNPTLNRFFALHYLFPFLIIGVVAIHLMALHTHGSNNPAGIDRTLPQESIPFHPYYTIKDIFGLGVFLLIFAFFVFFAPNFFGEPDNYIPADPMLTPPHIVPEWYFLPFYAILRSVPDKLGGVILMFGAILVLAAIPWLDSSPIRSARYRPLYKKFYWLFVLTAGVLVWIGARPPEGIYLAIGRLATAYYFAHFFLILPLLSKYERPLPLPANILGEKKPLPSESSTNSLTIAFILGLSGALFATLAPSLAHSNEQTPTKHLEWNHRKFFGGFDRAKLQRGFQVYKEVCATCHGLKLLSYRHLKELGFTDAQVKAIAAEYTITDGPNDEGEMYERRAEPKDHFHAPFPNDKAARAANNGALPPDLSLIVKAREHHEDHLYSILTGYQTPPAGVVVQGGLYYNPYMPGGQIAMPPPLTDGLVTYSDNTQATVGQMAEDVTCFLAWASEPELEKRKRLGIKVMLFLGMLTSLCYFSMRKIWSRIN